MKTIGILQPSYLPWLGFFDQISKSDTFVFYDDVQFDKNGWRNRNKIKTPNGEQWITVPVHHKGLPLLKEVKINDTVAWRDKQVKSIKQNYSKARFFSQYSDPLFSLIMDLNYTNLVDLSIKTVVWLMDCLGLKKELVKSSDLHIEGDRISRLISILKFFKADHFLEGNAGRDYINDEDFAFEGISVVYQEYIHPEYPQLYGKFISHLSTIDLLFNCGPDSLSILTSKGT